ncbi:MAG: InlB B-repeat-containing protein [Oscillibacter sp.]|nr:InlB B-repeat-containing protein [Oscillibacter sp.]
MKKQALGMIAALFVFALLLPMDSYAARTRYGEWSDWSDWSDNPPPSSTPEREIEQDTRQVTVIDGHTEYRYGRWVGATVNWCKEYGEALHGGTYSVQQTEWSATRATNTDTHWLCGHFDWEHSSHIHVSGYDYRGYPMWTRYRVDGYSNPDFYWEETRWVDPVYKTQYRWRWRSIYYDCTVFFNANGGTLDSVTQKEVTKDNTYGWLPTPIRRNYDFAGWYTSAEGGERITENTVVTRTDDHTLYAHWNYNPVRYTVFFNANGGTVDPNSKEVRDSEKYGELPIPTRTNYSFDGWYTSTDGGTKITENSTVNLSGNQTLYAHWNYNPVRYTVSFNANGGTVDPNSKEVMDSEKYGELPIPKKDHYQFDGWFTEDGQQITSASDVIPGDQTLYARWVEATYTVTFLPLGGTVNPSSKTVTYGKQYGPLPPPEQAGYRFDGWFDENGKQITSETIVELSGNQTLYARWIKNTFNVRRDAYSFGNGMEDFGYTSRGGPGGGPYPIPSESLFMIFGKTVKAKMQYKKVASAPWAGNCAGMSASVALLFAYGKLGPADFGKSDVWSLTIHDKNAEMSVRTFIEALQMAQYTEAFGQARQANQVLSGQSLDRLYQTVKADMAAGRPTLIAIFKNGVGGHALLAFDTDDASNRILIYDCNHPGELRYLTLSADRTAWSYDMGEYGVWRSADDACSISYVPYAVLEEIWTSRGSLKQNAQVLTVNAENLSITNFDGENVASLKNGRLVTSTDGVYELLDLSMRWTGERSICLPRNEVYTISTSDHVSLTASMTDEHMSAEVTTSANAVTFGVDDDEKSNSVIVEGASASDTYSITLESDFEDLLYKKVELSGTGQGGDVNVSLNEDAVPVFVNCNITSLSLNGKSALYGIASAAPDKDGKLSVTLTNPGAVTVAAAYFDASGKFVSVALRDVRTDVGTVMLSVPADAKKARVTLLDYEYRPLCEPFETPMG